METMPTSAGTIQELKAIVMVANLIARMFNDGELSTCILTSYALAAALTDLGYADARPVRVQASCSTNDRQLTGVSLGAPGSCLGFGRARARDVMEGASRGLHRAELAA